MTDRETLDKARALFTGATQGDTLAREVIAIAEQRENTIACEVEHSRKLEDPLKISASAVYHHRRKIKKVK